MGVTQKEIIEALLRGDWLSRRDVANRIESESIAPKPYVPMTDDERLDISRGMRIRTAEVGQIEHAVIKRAGLEIKHD